jgi:hypothetical protein
LVCDNAQISFDFVGIHGGVSLRMDFLDYGSKKERFGLREKTKGKIKTYKGGH